MTDVRKETDSLGEVSVPADKLWGAQTQRSLEHFSIGKDLMPREMITAYALLKEAAANANRAGGRLDEAVHGLIVQACDEILAGQHHDMFPLHVWMTGSGTQFNMNVNEVISNRCCQLAGTPLGSKKPVHPNDHVNMSQSSNDTSLGDVHRRRRQRRSALCRRCRRCTTRSRQGQGVGRHRQDRPHPHAGRDADHARPGMVGLCRHAGRRSRALEDALKGVYRLALGGTAVGTGINRAPGFAEAAAAEIAS
jgi:fumarate hydratase class II